MELEVIKLKMIEKTSYKKLWNIALVILHLLVVSNSLSSDIIAGGPEDGEGGHVVSIARVES